MQLDKDYLRIVEKLGLNTGEDRKARDILDSLVPENDWSVPEGMIRGNAVIVFGAGPSLKEDVRKFKESRICPTIIAADGATKALLEQGITPNIVATDLDGFEDALISASRLGSILVVHAHGDNIGRLKEVVPRLAGLIYGTTQVEPTEKIMNFGGFSDGDRAVYLAAHFKAERILLAGMDFGVVIGSYSGKRGGDRKRKKLEIGKRLIEELAEKSGVEMLNLTSGGEDIMGVTRRRDFFNL